MTRILTLLFLVTALAFPIGAVAQDDRGILQAFIEDNLSSAGRDVRISGLTGSLSKEASLDLLTIADAEGIWLTLRDVKLNWNRSALFAGRLDVNTLTAKEIILPRLPQTSPSAPSPVASTFSLPELPVSVLLDEIKAEKITVGAPILGQELSFVLAGQAQLETGAGKVALNVTRLDRPKDTFALAGGYSNTKRDLQLELSLTEADGGLVSGLIGLPGAPSLALDISGNAPIDDFTATISLDTDGSQRLSGDVTLKAAETSASEDNPSGHMNFAADIGGDIAPLFAEEYRSFFGPDVQLSLRGAKAESGALTIDQFNMTSAALDLQGALSLSPDSWPEQISVSGQIAAKNGELVRLPLPGTPTTVRQVTLSVDYDALNGQEWQSAFAITEFEQDALTFSTGRFDGAGTLRQGDGQSIGAVDGAFDLILSDLAPQDAALAQALGSAMTGRLAFRWQEETPLVIDAFAVNGADYSAEGSLQFSGLRGGINPSIDGKMNLQASDLTRFDALAAIPVAGAAHIDLVGSMTPFEGLFAVSIEGAASDLALGQDMIDPLLVGETVLSLAATRNTEGTKLSRLSITSPATRLTGRATWQEDDSFAELSAQVADVAVVLPDLSGAASLSFSTRQNAAIWRVTAEAEGPGQTEAGLSGAVTVENNEVTFIDGRLTGTAQSLRPFSKAAGQALTGEATFDLAGSGDPRDNSLEASVALSGSGVSVGIAEVDKLLSGALTASAKVVLASSGVLSFSDAAVTSPLVTARADGSFQRNGPGDVDFAVTLKNIGVLAPEFSGPVTAKGRAASRQDVWTVDVDATGAGGIEAELSGDIFPDGTLGLNVAGTAPLALAHSFIKPNALSGLGRFDLRLDGPAALRSLSGNVTTRDSFLAVPAAKITLSGIDANVALSRGTARVQANANVSTGGQVSTTGNINTASPFQTEMTVLLNSVGLTEPGLFSTTANGQVTFVGPAKNGAKIAGTINLGPVEIRVPNGQASGISDLPGLQHINESAAIRTTQSRAGLDSGGSGTSSTNAVYPIDFLVNATSRIFVRGRGLDAELGGSLRLLGTTQNLIPQGQFDLIRGRLDILGKRLALSEGYLQAQGSFDPYLHLVTRTQSADTEVIIAVDGQASAPEISFSSVPELPEDEVLSQLLFGRSLTKISAFQAVQLASAVATLAGKGGEGIVARIRQGVGLDDLDIATNAEGDTELRAGKYLSENVYSEVEVDSQGQSQINLNLELSPTVKARGSVGSDGSTGLGVFFEKDY